MSLGGGEIFSKHDAENQREQAIDSFVRSVSRQLEQGRRRFCLGDLGSSDEIRSVVRTRFTRAGWILTDYVAESLGRSCSYSRDVIEFS